MKLFLRFGNVIVLLLILLLFYIALDHFGYLPSKAFADDDFDIEFVPANIDKDNDGVDDYTDILNGAREFVAMEPEYKSAYYSGGYPTDDYYVCTDLIWYALDKAGYDFKALIDEDIKNNINDYDIEVQDTNIDFRRVRNIKVFLDKYTKSLTLDATDISAWQGGDIVVYEDHIGIVSDKRNESGVNYIIHHDGFHKYEEDGLTRKKIIGHYRFNLDMTKDEATEK